MEDLIDNVLGDNDSGGRDDSKEDNNANDDKVSPVFEEKRSVV
jgi:hypothetical protein